MRRIKPDQPAARDLSRCLCELMRARGHISETSHSGVDVVALAAASGVSYEMARRYAEGQAALDGAIVVVGVLILRELTRRAAR